MTTAHPMSPESNAISTKEPRVLACSGEELLALARPILEQGCRFRMRAPGLSMGRTIQHGELIEIAPCQSDDLRAGTIVFFERVGRPVAHRIIRRREANGTLTFFIRGDTLRGSAEEVSAEAILGKVTAVHRGDTWQPLPPLRRWPLIGRVAPWTTNWAWSLHRIRAPAGRLLRAVMDRAAVRRLLRRAARSRTWRRATPADRPLLMSLYQVGGPDEQQLDVVTPAIVDDFPTPDFLLIEDNGRILGAVGIFPEENAPPGERPWRLYSMKVHWRYRGQGIGELLLKAAVKTAQQEGGSSITLDVLETNVPSITLYEKYGFQRTAVRSQDSSAPGDGSPSMIRMELRLDDREESIPAHQFPSAPASVTTGPKEGSAAQQLTCEFLAQTTDGEPFETSARPAEPFDWEGWLRLVKREGLGGLFGYRCRADDQWAAVLPGAVRDQLAQLYYATTASNLRVFREVTSVINRFGQAGVEVMVLKGAHLAEAIYPSVGCRPMGDVDLLLRPADFSQAAHVLSGMGYEPLSSPEAEPPLAVGTTLNASWWRHPDPGRVSLHLHWHLRNTSLPYGLVTAVDDDRLWADAQGFDLAGYATRGLAPHHLLLHLADHAIVHRYDRLMLLADMAAVIERYGDSLDWPLLLDEARSFGLSSSLAMSLLLAARYAAASIPYEVLDTLTSVRLTTPERRMVDQFESHRGSLLWGWLIYGSRCSTWKTRLRFLWLTLRPDPTRLALQAGSATGWRGYLAFCARRLAGNRRHAA